MWVQFVTCWSVVRVIHPWPSFCQCLLDSQARRNYKYAPWEPEMYILLQSKLENITLVATKSVRDSEEFRNVNVDA